MQEADGAPNPQGWQKPRGIFFFTHAQPKIFFTTYSVLHHRNVYYLLTNPKAFLRLSISASPPRLRPGAPGLEVSPACRFTHLLARAADLRLELGFSWCPVFSTISAMSASTSALERFSWKRSALPLARPDGALVPSSSHFDMDCRRKLRKRGGNRPRASASEPHLDSPKGGSNRHGVRMRREVVAGRVPRAGGSSGRAKKMHSQGGRTPLPAHHQPCRAGQAEQPHPLLPSQLHRWRARESQLHQRARAGGGRRAASPHPGYTSVSYSCCAATCCFW